MKMKFILSFLFFISESTFLFNPYLYAQEGAIEKYKFSIELHLIEPSLLVFTHSFSKSNNWSVVVGSGFSGYAYNSHIYRRYVKANDFFGSSLDGYILDAALRRYIPFSQKKRLGILLQSGVFYRRLQWSNRRSEGRDMDEEVFTYLRSGIYFRPMVKIEFGALAGMGMQMNTTSRIYEFMAVAYIGYRLWRIKPK